MCRSPLLGNTSIALEPHQQKATRRTIILFDLVCMYFRCDSKLDDEEQWFVHACNDAISRPDNFTMDGTYKVIYDCVIGITDIL